ncbi:MAG: cbb3-type cytochrome c oxidase subunit 3 [Gammaproteobacteria bacterium]
MPDWLLWFTRYENSKMVALLLFFSVFCGIFIYLFSDRKRSARLESYKYMPLNDDQPDVTTPEGEDKGNE